MKDGAKFVEDLQKITKERMLLKDSYEKCCNDPGLGLGEKEIILNNFEVAYKSMNFVREKMLKCYMKN